VRYVREHALRSAQTTVFPRKYSVYSFEGVICGGQFRIHNPKVGGSIPPPATNFLLILNNLQRIDFLSVNYRVANLCPKQTARNV